MFIETILLVMLIGLAAFFSGAEIALFSLSDIKLRKLLRQKRRGAGMLRALKHNPHRLLVTILLVNNLATVGAAAIATAVFTGIFGSNGIGIATGVMTFLILVFGEITPKSFCLQNAEKVSLIVAGPVFVISKVLFPAVVVIERLSLALLRVTGYRSRRPRISREEIDAALSIAAEHGSIEKDEERMMQAILRFGDTKVPEVMIPREKMVAIGFNKKVSDVLTMMLGSRYSRIPVYGKCFDDMLGFVHAKDVLKCLKKGDLGAGIGHLVSEAIFVGEDMRLDHLMDQFRERGMHLAFVTGKNKRVKGIVTLEDLLEEIVGEIYDESDVLKALGIKPHAPAQKPLTGKHLKTGRPVKKYRHVGV
jgi:CBS domain containing-hemolysin-like protein